MSHLQDVSQSQVGLQEGFPPSRETDSVSPQHTEESSYYNQNQGSPPTPFFMGSSPSSRSQSPANLNASVISASITPQLIAKLQDKEKFAAIFIPENELTIPWRNSPSEYSWKWNNPARVKLPMSSDWRKNVISEDGSSVSIPRWRIIEDQLTNLRESCQEERNLSKLMKEVVGNYNRKLSQVCNFEVLKDNELAQRLTRVLPVIIEYCMQMPYKLRKSIPFLRKGQWHTLFLTRGLCASLLANAFLCTFPHHDRDPKELPHFHFLKLFHDGSEGPVRTQVKIEKIKCVLDYFEQLRNADKNELDAIISFERRCISRRQNWSYSDKILGQVWPNNTDTIEDAVGLLQADFANKYVGGGILSVGMVQEEIRFAICPDLIVSRLFTEVLGDDEVLVVTGAKQFSSYKGYRTTFEWEKREKPQELKRDDLGREMLQLVAMDALFFKQGSEWTQYQQHKIDRELHKCSVAFKMGSVHQQEIATGNWGCGAFNGDPQLKFIIQWMACSQMGRPSLVYYTVGNNKQFEEIRNFFDHVSAKQVSVGKMYRILGKYERGGHIHGRNPIPVFDFVRKNI